MFPRFCEQTSTVIKHGKGHAGYPCYRCTDCNKTFQLSYAYKAREAGAEQKVLAHVFGPRTDATCKRLLALLSSLNIRFICTDDWWSYKRHITDEQHLTGKIFTQRIERHNLNLRAHIKRLERKTICFSRSFEIHEKVIGHYLEIHHYNGSET